MYRGSDFGVTLSVSTLDAESSYLRRDVTSSRTRFMPNNIGAAFNVFQGKSGVTGVTLGVGYNRLADFNRVTTAQGSGAPNSITEYFAEQLNGIAEGNLKGTDTDPYVPFRNYGVAKWGGILGYQTGMMNPLPNGNQYSPWDVLSETAGVNPYMRRTTRGSIGEYTFSGGINLQNRVYLGMTIGIQDIYYRNENNYIEMYDGNTKSLTAMNYIQNLKMDGTGVNFKFGAVVRPTDNFRIGLAVHTPTFVSVNEEYIEYMAADYANQKPGGLLDSPYSINEYNMQTPTHLLAGLSYVISGVGLITADYERVWYNGMRLRNTDFNTGAYEDMVKQGVVNSYKAANNFRVGVELNPIPELFVRGGYANYGDCRKYNDAVVDNQLDVYAHQNYSVGIGVRVNTFYTDLTYVYTDYKYVPSDIFYYYDKGADYTVTSGTISTKSKRNSFMLSMGVKF